MAAVLFHCLQSCLLCGSRSTRAVAHQICVDHYYPCVHIAYACLFCATIRVFTLHMRVCSVCAMIRVRVCRCVRVCVLLCLNPTFFLCVCSACCCRIMSCLYHTVPQDLKLSTRCQPRYNSSPTASLCGPLLTMRVLTAYACALCVLACVYSWCLRVCGFVC